MPNCHRCDRTFPTAEVRRTTKGHVCKDAVSCKRRLNETRGAVVDGALADRLASHWKVFDQQADQHSPLATLAALRDMNQALTEVVVDVVARAGRETKLTQKQLATALGVPPSMLRGLRA